MLFQSKINIKKKEQCGAKKSRGFNKNLKASR